MATSIEIIERKKDFRPFILSIIAIFVVGFVFTNISYETETEIETDTHAPSKTASKSKPYKTIKLYRGVASDDPNYEDALKGIAMPRGGPSSASMHQRGFTDSDYVSFSRSKEKAAAFGTAQHKGGRGKGAILMIELPECDPRLVDVRNLPGGDVFKEQEVMIRGGIVGCKVAKIDQNTLSEEFKFKTPKQ